MTKAYIKSNPNIMMGTPVISGTRITVAGNPNMPPVALAAHLLWSFFLYVTAYLAT